MNNILKMRSIPLQGRPWTDEVKIIFALMSRLKISEVELTDCELDPEEGGLIISPTSDDLGVQTGFKVVIFTGDEEEK